MYQVVSAKRPSTSMRHLVNGLPGMARESWASRFETTLCGQGSIFREAMGDEPLCPRCARRAAARDAEKPASVARPASADLISSYGDQTLIARVQNCWSSRAKALREAPDADSQEAAGRYEAGVTILETAQRIVRGEQL